MEFILYSGGILIIFFLFFTLIEKPYVVASLLIFFYIYGLNFEIPGPLDTRGLLTTVLFGRLFLFDKQNFLIVRNHLLRDKNAILLFIFIFLNLYTTYMFYGELQNIIKSSILLIVSSILGFIIIINGKGRKVFFNAIVMSGIISVIDVFYSTMTYSSLRIRSLIKLFLLNDTTTINHNGTGFLCSIAFIMVYIYFIRKRLSKKISFLFMFILSLGLVLSTSRSSMIALIMVLLISLLVQKEITFNLNKILISFLGIFLFLVSFYFVYNSFFSSGQLKSSFVDQTYFRLYEEPMSIFGGNEEKVFDKYGFERVGNTRWRINRANTDIERYFQLELEIQLFGLGLRGYVNNQFGGDDANAHNGYVLLLVERGIIGFLILFFVLTNLSYKSLQLLRNQSINTPLVYVILIIIFYTIGQNSDLTSVLAFLLYGALIANTKEYLFHEKTAEEIIYTDLNRKNILGKTSIKI